MANASAPNVLLIHLIVFCIMLFQCLCFFPWFFVFFLSWDSWSSTFGIITQAPSGRQCNVYHESCWRNSSFVMRTVEWFSLLPSFWLVVEWRSFLECRVSLGSRSIVPTSVSLTLSLHDQKLWSQPAVCRRCDHPHWTTQQPYPPTWLWTSYYIGDQTKRS